MRVMLGEITTEGNRAQAYSIWATAASLGTLLAPVAGGLLARPSDHYSLFRGVQIFERYPYLLPSLLMGLLGGGATIVAILFLREVSIVSLSARAPTTNRTYRPLRAKSRALWTMAEIQPRRSCVLRACRAFSSMAFGRAACFSPGWLVSVAERPETHQIC